MSELKERIEDAVRLADPKLKRTASGWTEACFLFAALIVGSDPESIADTLEMDPAFAGMLAERCRASKIWPLDEHRWDGEDGGMQLWMDTCVLSGDVETRDGENYRLTDDGLRRVARMVKQ